MTSVGGGAGDIAQQVKAFVECLCSIPGMHTVKGQSLGHQAKQKSVSTLCGTRSLGAKALPTSQQGPQIPDRSPQQR